MYTYRVTGQTQMASGVAAPVYTAHHNGTGVATVAQWVPMAGGNKWGATCLASGATGSGATRSAAVTAALGNSGPVCGNCTWVGTCANTGNCTHTAPCPTCASTAGACAVCGWCYVCTMCAGCHAGNPMCPQCNSTQCPGTGGPACQATAANAW